MRLRIQASIKTISSHAEGDRWVMGLEEAVKEHKDLVHALKTKTRKDDKKEIREQGDELKRMEKSRRVQAGFRRFLAKPVILNQSFFFLKLVPNPENPNELLMSFFSPALRLTVPNGAPVYPIDISDRGTNQIRKDLNKLVIPYMRQDILEEDHAALEKVLFRLRRIVLKDAQEYQDLTDEEKKSWKSLTKLNIQKFSDIGVRIQEDGEPVEKIASTASGHYNTLMVALKKYLEMAEGLQDPDKIAQVSKWMQEVDAGHATDPSLVKWLKNIENYYAPKDRDYARYLNSLHPESPNEYL
jgi:hypothetical protein